MTNQNVLFQKVEEHIGVVTLNRPQKRNALTPELLEEFDHLLATVAKDEKIRVVVIRGEGPSFCSGYDLTPGMGYEGSSQDLTADRRRELSHIKRWYGLWEYPKPIIAQVHGHALAGGCELALMCDITIAANDAQIGFPIVRGQATPPVQIYPWLVGMKKAKELLLAGEISSGAEAEQIGLINKAVPVEELEETVMKLARKIASGPPDILWLTKAGINRSFEIMGFRNAILSGFDLHIIGHHSKSSLEFYESVKKEGLNSALSKRDRNYK